MRRVFGPEGLFERDAQRLGHSLAVCRVGIVTVARVALFDEQLGIAHGARRIFAGGFPVFCRHHAPQQAGLREIVAVQFALVVVVNVAVHGQGRLFEGGVVLPFAVAVGFVTLCRSVVAVGAHLPVAVEGVERAAGPIHGDFRVVHAQAVALCVAVGEQAPLQHLVGREADAFDDVHRVERRLLDIGIVILGIAVQFQHAHLVQREILVVPHLRQVERVELVVARLFLGH